MLSHICTRYIDYKLNSSVKKSFDAFKEGFWMVTDSSDALKRLFTSVELENLLCGTQDVDFLALRRITKYDGFAEADKAGTENKIVVFVTNFCSLFRPISQQLQKPFLVVVARAANTRRVQRVPSCVLAGGRLVPPELWDGCTVLFCLFQWPRGER
jgi:hypothetical protein